MEPDQRGLVITPAASPWPNQPCPQRGCGRQIRDLLAEMVPDNEQSSAEFKAVVGQQPGGAITCPFCQGAVEYEADGKTLVASQRTPLRYSRTKMERRAKDYGSQENPPNLEPDARKNGSRKRSSCPEHCKGTAIRRIPDHETHPRRNRVPVRLVA